VDKKKLKQGTRVALDMTTLTIMRFIVLLYVIVATFHSTKVLELFIAGQMVWEIEFPWKVSE